MCVILYVRICTRVCTYTTSPYAYCIYHVQTHVYIHMYIDLYVCIYICAFYMKIHRVCVCVCASCRAVRGIHGEPCPQTGLSLEKTRDPPVWSKFTAGLHLSDSPCEDALEDRFNDTY